MDTRGRWVGLAVVASLVAMWPLSSAAATTSMPKSRTSGAWQPLGPEGGSPAVITFDPAHPDTIYVGTFLQRSNGGTSGGGIFRSEDGGKTWESLRFGPSDDISAVVLDPANSNTIYGAGSKGVFKTTDGGATWTPANEGLPVLHDVADLAIDPSDSQVLYASSGRSLYKTTDGGGTWVEIGGLSGLNVFRAEDLAVDPTNTQVVYLTVQFRCEACWSGGVLKSTDGGASWGEIRTGLSGTADYHDLLIDPTNPSVLYVRDREVAEGGGGVYRTTDAGAQWTFASTGLPFEDGIPVEALAIDPSQPSVLYAGVDGHSELYRTGNGASSWNAIVTGLPVDVVAPVAIDPANPNVLLAGTSEPGVYRSDTDGTSWTSSVAGFTNTIADDVVSAPSNPAILYAWIEFGAQGDGVYRSTSAGRSWSWASSGLPITIFHVGLLAVDPTDPEVAYASIFASGVYKTTNGGASWASVSSGLGDLYVGQLVIDPSDPQVLYVVDGLGLYKSTDGGQSWTEASVGLGTYPHPSALAIDASNAQTLFVSSQDSAGPTYNHKVYKSSDGALTWHLSNTGMEAADVVSLAVSPTGSGILFAGTIKDGVYGSGDDGATWRHRTSHLFGFVYGVASDAVDPLTAYVGTQAQGVWRTQDAGRTWTPIKRGLTSRRIDALAVTSDGSRIYAATFGGGVFGANL